MVDVDELRTLQTPLKERYRSDPDRALVTLEADGDLRGEGLTCSVRTGAALVEAGLHPATGGDGLAACSGDLLLQALVACAGVTLRAVATALEVHLDDARIHAEGDLDFRGTLGVDRDAPVGFSAVRLTFELDSDAEPSVLAKVVELTERYCVVLRTLVDGPEVITTFRGR